MAELSSQTVNKHIRQLIDIPGLNYNTAAAKSRLLSSGYTGNVPGKVLTVGTGCFEDCGRICEESAADRRALK